VDRLPICSRKRSCASANRSSSSSNCVFWATTCLSSSTLDRSAATMSAGSTPGNLARTSLPLRRDHFIIGGIAAFSRDLPYPSSQALRIASLMAAINASPPSFSDFSISVASNSTE
jgi:hypothetical protein